MSTIAAISTATGVGGISIIRMSGENCFEILDKFFVPKNKSKDVKGYTIKYGHIYYKEKMIDEVLVSYFKAPNSYTKENMCEINSHGSTYIANKILEICLENGAKLAEPGEFTKIAFLNGRIDLSQAESVIDLINSKTEKEATTSINQLEGFLSNKISKIRQKLMDIMVLSEVSIDYPEYDVEEVTNQKVLDSLEEVKCDLERLSNSFETGKIIKDGINIALIGKPNAGKSSLLNRILKEERAIVTDIEGTTRDTIQEHVNIKGIPVRLIDTAGIRNATNEIEKIGIEKSKKIANQADLVIAIFDITKPLDKDEIEILESIKSKKGIIILNKIDIEHSDELENNIKKYINNKEIIKISAKEDIGIEKIYEKILEMFKLNEISIDNSEMITNIRHKNIIDNSLKITKEAILTVENKMPIDIISINIKSIMEELGKITGDCVSEDIIKEIFSKFCLGK